MWIVTGSTGFIGSALAWELNRAGHHQITLCDHVHPDSRPELFRYLKYSQFVYAKDLMKEIKNLKNVRGVWHMGACSSTTEMNVEYLTENNVEYSKELFRWCTENKVPYIYASSASVYGNGSRGFEDTINTSILEPMNPYGRSKLQFDHWVVQQKDTPPLWYGLRFFNVFGPNESFKGEQASVVFKAFNQISETGRLKLFKSHNPQYKDGEQKRDFVYVKDVSAWIYYLSQSRELQSGIYNMGFGQARTWLDLAYAVFRALEKPAQIDFIDIPEHIRSHYQYFTEAKMEHAFSRGLPRPQWSLERGVEDYVKNYLMKPYSFLGGEG